MNDASHTVISLWQLIESGKTGSEITPLITSCRSTNETRAGLYLLNGDWELAHKTSQAAKSAQGSHWHALVHRHEPDYPNAKYWYHKVGESPVYEILHAAADKAGKLHLVAPAGRWDPTVFTDCYADPSTRDWSAPLDQLEMKTLLARCIGG